jgi:tetratricopeptide (TPR) repeat protein
MTQSIQHKVPGAFERWTRNASLGLLLAVACVATISTASAAEKAKGPEISRVIAKEMTAAQKALQAGQWAEALKNLDEAETKSGLTAFDKKTIYNFKGFADVKLGNLKAAQTEFERTLATGAATPEEVTSITRTLFGISASTNQYQKTIDYGKQMVDAGNATADNVAIIAQSYYQLKDCKNASAWSDKAIAATR